MVEELLVDGLRVLVGQQAANSQLLVDEVGHGELLTHQLWGELRGEQPTWPQQGLQGTRRGRWWRRRHLACTQRRAVVEGAVGRGLLLGRRRLLRRLGGRLWISRSRLEEGTAGSQVTELRQAGQVRRRSLAQHTEVGHVVSLNWRGETVWGQTTTFTSADRCGQKATSTLCFKHVTATFTTTVHTIPHISVDEA